MQSVPFPPSSWRPLHHGVHCAIARGPLSICRSNDSIVHTYPMSPTSSTSSSNTTTTSSSKGGAFAANLKQQQAALACCSSRGKEMDAFKGDRPKERSDGTGVYLDEGCCGLSAALIHGAVLAGLGFQDPSYNCFVSLYADTNYLYVRMMGSAQSQRRKCQEA